MYLSSIYYICTMFENPGGHAPLPTPMTPSVTTLSSAFLALNEFITVENEQQ